MIQTRIEAHQSARKKESADSWLCFQVYYDGYVDFPASDIGIGFTMIFI